MPTVTKRKNADGSYLALVRAFPLRRLKSAAEHAEAKSIYLRVSRSTMDLGARDYVEVLIDQIADYEKRMNHTIDTSAVSAAELIRHRMEERGMSISTLARQTGIAQPNLSEMLSGNRDWSKAAIKALSALLNIRAERFLI